MEGAVWGVAEEYGDAGLERCRAFMPVLGPLQTVQRAELWGAIVALQAHWPCHLGIDNLPLPLVKDGDLAAIAMYMIQAREQDTVWGH